MTRHARSLSRAAAALLAALLLAPAAAAAAPAAGPEMAAAADRATPALTAAFAAALAGDFDAYLEAIHPDERANKTQISGLKRYCWARFKRQAAWYLGTKDDPSSFEIEKHDAAGDDKIRVFIKDQLHDKRMPVPVRLKLVNSGAAKGKWLITANSL